MVNTDSILPWHGLGKDMSYSFIELEAMEMDICIEEGCDALISVTIYVRLLRIWYFNYSILDKWFQRDLQPLQA